uniref:RRM domain-containing protein n=1 Tax=Bursaphelenchus xylophilus TaxID=6326 RepID=A0A1I7SMN7_BURXY
MDEYQEYGKMSQFQQKLNSKLEHNARSVFVGNISYDVTEEEIKQLFSRVGNIVHFRLVHDRDTGRPKGFGFCEFTEPPMADAAIRHFQGYELHGRALRVDSASASDRNVEETQQMQAAVQAAKEQFTRVEENIYGKETEHGKAPEAIAKTVASLPPEQMFELMKQMKHTVTSNPSQLRQFLSENPQLAYALLQAQVVMRVVDPKVAYTMLHRETPVTQQPFHKMPGINNGGSNVYVGPPPVPYNPPMPPPRNIPFGGPPSSSAPHRYGGPPVQVSPIPGPVVTSAAASNAAINDDEQQAQLLIRVMQLSPEDIACLDEEERIKVQALRQQLLNVT